MEQGKQIERKVYQYCLSHQMFVQGDHVLVALSGGGDSVCLLHLLLSLRDTLGIRISAAHIHHGLRESADRDEAFAKQLCETYGISFYARRVDVKETAEKEKMGIEEAARDLRYEQLWDIAKEAGAHKLAVAHHMDDQAETVLFSLCRGSGIRGMAGMHPVSGQLVRPMLCLERAEIETYLSERGLSFVTDETNEDLAYTRNRIRRQILPMLCEEVNAGTVSHLARFSETMAQMGEYLSHEIEEAKANCFLEAGDLPGTRMVLSIPALLSYPVFLQREILHLCITETAGQRKDISTVHTESVLGLCHGISGKEVNLPYQVRVRRDYDRLCFYQGDAPDGKLLEETEPFIPLLNEKGRKVLEKGEELELFFGGRRFLCSLMEPPRGEELAKIIPRKRYTKWLDYDKIDRSAGLRMAEQKDWLYFDGSRKKTAKDCFKDEKLSSELRKSRIVLAVEDHILCFLPGRMDQSVMVTESTKQILQIRLSHEKEEPDKEG